MGTSSRSNSSAPLSSTVEHIEPEPGSRSGIHEINDQLSSIMSGIAISADDLNRMIQEGKGTDVNELIARKLHERQAA